jgi:hypothetical protein
MECKKYYIAVCNVVRERTKYGITSKNYRITIFYVLIYYIYVNTNYPECPIYPTQHPLTQFDAHGLHAVGDRDGNDLRLSL